MRYYFMIFLTVLIMTGCSSTDKIKETPTISTEKPAGKVKPKWKNPTEKLLGENVAPISHALTHIMKRLFPICQEYKNINYCTKKINGQNRLVKFTLTNIGSPNINPTGTLQYPYVPRREYQFNLEQGNLHNIFMEVYEFAIPNGRDSRTSMYSHFYFFPRKVIPSITITPMGNYQVILPTGEKVIFSKNREIISGVLKENSPIDLSRRYHSRRFADIQYTGKGMMVRVDQRGDLPESEKAWGRLTKKLATISYLNRVCKMRPAKLWRQTGDYALLYSNDHAFWRMLSHQCGWTDLPSPN